MDFDVKIHKCTIVIDQNLSVGLAANAASVIGIGFGKTVNNLVGPDMQSNNDVNYPGVIYAPLPVLKSSSDYIMELLNIAEQEDDIYCMPFSDLAQSCKTYDEYGERINSTKSEDIGLVAIGLIGPKKKVSKLTGGLSLYQ